MAVACKDVRFGARTCRAGDVVSNVDTARGVRRARLSVLAGGKSAQ
jgi:hypothetical protein